MTQNNLGTALQEQGIRTGGEQAAQLLGRAVQAYESALQIFTKDLLPQQWASTQNNLGAALQEQVLNDNYFCASTTAKTVR